MTLHDKLLTTKEVCDYLRISNRTLRRYTRQRTLPYIRLSNGLIRFSLSAINESLREKEIRPGVSVTGGGV
jgi:excisionase family DNA binding protein